MARTKKSILRGQILSLEEADAILAEAVEQRIKDFEAAAAHYFSRIQAAHKGVEQTSALVERAQRLIDRMSVSPESFGGLLDDVLEHLEQAQIAMKVNEASEQELRERAAKSDGVKFVLRRKEQEEQARLAEEAAKAEAERLAREEEQQRKWEQQEALERAEAEHDFAVKKTADELDEFNKRVINEAQADGRVLDWKTALIAAIPEAKKNARKAKGNQPASVPEVRKEMLDILVKIIPIGTFRYGKYVGDELVSSGTIEGFLKNLVIQADQEAFRARQEAKNAPVPEPSPEPAPAPVEVKAEPVSEPAVVSAPAPVYEDADEPEEQSRQTRKQKTAAKIANKKAWRERRRQQSEEELG